MFPVAIVCGNTYVFKPSERVPGATMLLVKLLQDAGCPDGVVNVIHGQRDAVNFVCDYPAIRAISFVGSDVAVSCTGLSGYQGDILCVIRCGCELHRTIRRSGRYPSTDPILL